MQQQQQRWGPHIQQSCSEVAAGAFAGVFEQVACGSYVIL